MAVVPKIVVVGAGFGGLEVVRNLSGKPVDITLIDRNNFHTFQPLLYQVATAGLNAADVATVVRGQLQRQPNVRFLQDDVTVVNWTPGAVQLASEGPLARTHLMRAGRAPVNPLRPPAGADHPSPPDPLDNPTTTI